MFAMRNELDAGAVTGLLQCWTLGDRDALERLLPLVYDELRAIARGYMRQERQGHTLSPTALVHEAFLRLGGESQVSWRDRRHFYGIAARLMRQALVDHARHHGALKRSPEPGLPPSPGSFVPPELAEDYLAIDACLDDLERHDARKAQIVELRFFGGLTIEEIAEATALSPTMVKKELSVAKLWLFRHMQPTTAP